MYLVDTDWVIDYLNGRLDAIAFIDQLRPHGLAVSAMTVGEVYAGIFRRPNADRKEMEWEHWLSTVTLHVIDAETARLFGLLRADLKNQGQTIETADILIAVAALQHNLILVTRNVRHFERIPDLKLHHAS